jgi:hypothetical protein
MKDWNKKKSRLKLKYKEITGKDLNYQLGEEGFMLDQLKNKLGLSKEELLKIIIEF